MPPVEVMNIVEELKDVWMTPIWEYLKGFVLPKDKAEARRLRYKFARYVIYDEKLYMRVFNQPLLRCINGDECDYILREIHEGI